MIYNLNPCATKTDLSKEIKNLLIIMACYLQGSPLKFKVLSFIENADGLLEDVSRLNLNSKEITNSPIPFISRRRK